MNSTQTKLILNSPVSIVCRPSSILYPRMTTCCFSSKNLLLEHHGRVDDLILCKGAFTEANELQDEMQTLKGYGIKGAPRGVEPAITVPLFYDFKPVAYDEPLLLVRTNVLSSHAASLLQPLVLRFYPVHFLSSPRVLVYEVRVFPHSIKYCRSTHYISVHTTELNGGTFKQMW